MTTTATRSRRCDGCGSSFSDLLDLVRHRDDCDASAGNTYGRHEAAAEAAAHAAAWAAEEDWSASRQPRPSVSRPNRYAGPCASCGHRVEAGAGTFVKVDGRFSAQHLDGDCPDAPAAPAEAPAVRSNRFAGPCGRCGQRVPADEGTVAKVDGVWIASHLGDCPPAAEAPADDYEPARGDAHLLDGTYYRVSVGQSSRRLYANRWNGHGWEYAKGALGRLTTATMVTAEQAAAFGHATESCVFCGHDLDLPESISVGYGSTCASNRGLPWGPG